jgi:hypothetical protein
MKRYTFTLLALLLAFQGQVLAQAPVPVSETISQNGAVDWSNKVIQAKGIAIQGGVGGRAGQIRAAELDALRQILETVKGMRLNSETTVENFMLTSDVITTKVHGIARNFQRVGDPVYMSDGSIEVTVEMNLLGSGQFFDVVMPIAMGGGMPFYSGTVNDNSVYTGLVLDARGLGLRPAIAPRVVSEDDDEIYGSRFVDREWAIKNGMTGYAKDIESAKKDERVGGNPMVVKAVKVSGPNRTDVVISEDDARRLHAVTRNFSFLKECRVIILVD